MRHRLPAKHLPALLGAATLLIGPIEAAAETAKTDSDWQYGLSLYFFAPSIKGSTAAGSDIDVGFDTLLDNLNMTFMGAFEARKGRWSILADALYLNVGASSGAEVPVTGPGPLGLTRTFEADARVKQRGWVLSLLGGYNLRDDDKLKLDAIAGLRYLEMKATFSLGLESRRFGRAVEQSALGVAWDGVVGVRGRAKLSPRWHLPFHLDLGAGDSELTWQAAGGIGYRFDWGDLDLTYRHLHWDLASGNNLDHISFSGPQLTATIRF